MKGKMKKSVLSVALALLMTLSCAAALSGTAAAEERMLVPGGMAFGVKFFAKGAIVLGISDVETASGISSPAREAGLESSDIITKINDMEVTSAEQLLAEISKCGGKPVSLCYMRGDTESTISVTPALDKNTGGYRLGLWVRDSTAGIGTITFVDAETKQFGGLGHGITDTETSLLMPLSRGVIVDVAITDVVKGRKNAPGELKGTFGREKTGELYANTEEGVFGYYTKMPELTEQALPVADRQELTTGKAYLITTLDGERPAHYEIEIEKIYDNSGKTKNFLIHVTDEALLERAGGIVQGMSGSPIVKDGKLIGAVTHVLVSDPTRGYGIHIDNMLDEAQVQE